MDLNSPLGKTYLHLNWASNFSMARKNEYIRGDKRTLWLVLAGILTIIVAHSTIIVFEWYLAENGSFWVVTGICACFSAIVWPIVQHVSNRWANSEMIEQWIAFRSYVERMLSDVYVARVDGTNFAKLSLRAKNQLESLCAQHEVPAPVEDDLRRSWTEQRDKWLYCPDDDGHSSLTLTGYYELRAIYQRNWMNGKIAGDCTKAEQIHGRIQLWILLFMVVLAIVPVLGMTLVLGARVLADFQFRRFQIMRWRETKTGYKSQVTLINEHLAKVKQWQLEFVEKLLKTHDQATALNSFVNDHPEAVVSDESLIAFLDAHLTGEVQFESSVIAHQRSQLSHLVESIELILSAGHRSWASNLEEAAEETDFTPEFV